MPSRKQRRRRVKERRHDYEYVYVDEEGREVDAAEAEAEAQPPTTANGGKPAGGPTSGRGGRRIEPPSWRRVGKRALIFAPFMFVVITLLENDLSATARVLFTLQMVLLFLPFSYLMDTMTYRVWRKRAARAEAGAAKRR